MTHRLSLLFFAGMTLFAAEPGGDADAPAGPEPIVTPDGVFENEEREITGRIRWFNEGRVLPDGRYLPRARAKAYALIRENEAKGLLAPATDAIPGTSWQPLPNSASGSIGRVTALAVDPTDNDTVWLGAASGGVWKTVNDGVSWTPLTDDQPTLAIGSLAIAPSNRNVVYAGTGEANASCDSFFGEGILKTVDGGASWTLVGQADFGGMSVSRIVVHPSNPDILWASVTAGASGSFYCAKPAATAGGLWRSADGGATWSRRSAGNADRVIIDPANPSVLYASFYAGGASAFRKSTDGGVTWNNLTFPSSPAGRTNLAIRASDGRLFATYDVSNSARIRSSTDGGASWSAESAPTYCPSYCWYFLGLEVSPFDGAVWGQGISTSRSTNNGTSFSGIYTGHSDHHATAFGSGQTVWIGTDGGVARSTNNGSSWSSRNGNIDIHQYYPGGAMHASNINYLMFGAQDNGTQQMNGATWTQVNGADGAFCAIDPGNSQIQYSSYQNAAFFKSTNGGSSWGAATTGLSTTGSNFINAYVMCPNNSSTFITVISQVWRSTNAMGSWSAYGPANLAGANLNSIAFAKSDASCNTFFVGSLNGRVYRNTTAAANLTNISTGLPGVTGRGVQSLSVHPTNSSIVYAGLGGYGPNVWKTTNAQAATPTWSNVSSGLPDMPVNAVLVDPTDGNIVYIGTDVGIFRSADGGASWANFSNGLPNVVVFSLVANAAGTSLVAGTHGRGAWRLATQPPGEAGVISPLRVGKNGANFTFAWGAGNSCGAAEYGLYRGNLATLRTAGYTHSTALSCAGVSTGAAVPQNDVRLTAADYFLAVAGNGAAEGSYGRSSSGVEIPPSTGACRASQTLSTCP